MTENENVCYAKSSPTAALVWITLAFFAGFAGVSELRADYRQKLKQTMAMSPLKMGLLAACPALTGSLLRIPFGAMVDRMGGKKPILIQLCCASRVAGITLMFSIAPVPTAAHYPFSLLFGILCGCGIAVFSVGSLGVLNGTPRRNRAEPWPFMPGWEISPRASLPWCCRGWSSL